MALQLNNIFKKLPTLSSQNLLDLLEKSQMANTLAKKEKRPLIVKLQKAIVKTIYKKYPDVFKKQGFEISFIK